MVLRPRPRPKPQPRVSKPAYESALHFLARPKQYPLTDAERADLIQVVEGCIKPARPRGARRGIEWTRRALSPAGTGAAVLTRRVRSVSFGLGATGGCVWRCLDGSGGNLRRCQSTWELAPVGLLATGPFCRAHPVQAGSCRGTRQFQNRPIPSAVLTFLVRCGRPVVSDNGHKPAPGPDPVCR
jgi:hypothetical protein